jgi:hypothetical protein
MPSEEDGRTGKGKAHNARRMRGGPGRTRHSRTRCRRIWAAPHRRYCLETSKEHGRVNSCVDEVPAATGWQNPAGRLQFPEER